LTCVGFSIVFKNDCFIRTNFCDKWVLVGVIFN
jgi:hypothetical protein